MLSLQATGFLLSELCAQLDLCLPPAARRRLLDQAPPDAESFTAAVFAAEGMEDRAGDADLRRAALAFAEQTYAEHGSQDA